MHEFDSLFCAHVLLGQPLWHHCGYIHVQCTVMYMYMYRAVVMSSHVKLPWTVCREAEKTKLLISQQKQKVVEKEAETDRKKAGEYLTSYQYTQS